MAEPEAILALGIIVGREMGYCTIPVLAMPVEDQARLPEGKLPVQRGGLIVLA